MFKYWRRNRNERLYEEFHSKHWNRIWGACRAENVSSEGNLVAWQKHQNCYVSWETSIINFGTIFATFDFRFRVFFVGVVGIVVVSTVLEFCVHKPSKWLWMRNTNCRWIHSLNNKSFLFADDLLVAFSLWKNTKSLISMKRNPSDIGTIHGIRFINAILLVISHKTMAVFFNPHVNRTTMIEVSFGHDIHHLDMQNKLNSVCRHWVNTFRWLDVPQHCIQMYFFCWAVCSLRIRSSADCSENNRHAFFRNTLVDLYASCRH